MPSISEAMTMAIENRTRMLADNVTDNNALLTKLKSRGKVKPVDGGREIWQEVEYADNETYQGISGSEMFDINPNPFATSAKYDWAEVVVTISMNRLEQVQNAGKSRMVDHLMAKIKNAEKSMVNGLSKDLYSDGTAYGGKQINGLQAALTATPTSGTYGGIDRSTDTWWQHKYTSADITNANVLEEMMKMRVQLVRNRDKPDIIPMDDKMYTNLWTALQKQERFIDESMAKAGFTNLMFIDAPCIHDGGVGGSCPEGTAFFLNCDYLFWRPAKGNDMVNLERVRSINQTDFVQTMYWAGQLTASNMSLQGRLFDST